MDDLISRQAAIDTLENTKTAISENGERYIAKQNAIMRIDALPSAEPEPSQVAKDIARIVENEQDMRILPKRGRWISADAIFGGVPFYCSECGENTRDTVMGKPRWNFCPNCGADMRGEQDDESRSKSNAQTDTRARGMGTTDKSSGI